MITILSYLITKSNKITDESGCSYINSVIIKDF